MAHLWTFDVENLFTEQLYTEQIKAHTYVISFLPHPVYLW